MADDFWFWVSGGCIIFGFVVFAMGVVTVAAEPFLDFVKAAWHMVAYSPDWVKQISFGGALLMTGLIMWNDEKVHKNG